jgi:hypothetical protein
MPHSHPNSVTTPNPTSNPTQPDTTPTTPNPDQPLTPTLFQQIQSLFLLKNTPIHTLYTQFQLSLTVLFSILHDHTTLTLRRAIDEHTYLCAQRAHLELILETENVAIALAKTENPTQEQRRRLGTLNATLKTSFKNLQALRGSLFNDDDTTSTHTPKPTHTKRTTARGPSSRANTNPTPTTPTSTPPHTAPTPTPPTPSTQSIYNNSPDTTPHTNSNPTHTAPTSTQPTFHTTQNPVQHTTLTPDQLFPIHDLPLLPSVVPPVR